MKRISTILIAGLLFLIVLVMLFPLVFKKEIRTVALEKANSAINATINYESFSVNILKSFPDITATFTDVSVTGEEVFDGDTLVAFDKFSTTIDLAYLIKGNGVRVREINIEKPIVKLIVDKTGSANWDILNATETTNTEKQRESESYLQLLLDEFLISGMNFSYIDRENRMEMHFSGSNARVNGNLEDNSGIFDLMISLDNITFDYDSIRYVNKGSIDLNSKFLANLDTYSYTFQDNQSVLNGVNIELSGGIQMETDTIQTDLAFNVPGLTVRELFEMVPAAYQNSISGIDAIGNMSFNGKIVGPYYGAVYPEMDIQLGMSDVVIKYPDLPDEITIIKAKAEIIKPVGKIDLLVAGISDLNMEIAGNPLSMHATFTNLTTDPFMDIAVKGSIDLENIENVFPIENASLGGIINTDFLIKGSYSSVENETYDQFTSSGTANLKDFSYSSSDIPQSVNIHNAALVLDKQDLNIVGLTGKMGESDFNLFGKTKNIISWFMGDAVLVGDYRLNSDFINANEFLDSEDDTLEPDMRDTTATKNEKLVFPKRMEMIFRSDIKRLLFDQMDITKFKGSISLKNQKLTLDDLTMDMLDGKLAMSGHVLADGREKPEVNFDLNVIRFDLPAAHQDLSIVQKYLPFAGKSKGEFSTSVSLKSFLKPGYEIDLNDLRANGTLKTYDVEIIKTKAFENLKKVIKTNQFKKITVDDFSASFIINNGTLAMKPFRTKILDQPVRLEGKYNLTGNIDFRADAEINKAILSNEIQQMISYIPGHESVKTVDVGLDIDGDATKPNVKVDTDKIKKQVIKQLKDSSPQELQDAAKKLLKQFFK